MDCSPWLVWSITLNIQKSNFVLFHLHLKRATYSSKLYIFDSQKNGNVSLEDYIFPGNSISSFVWYILLMDAIMQFFFYYYCEYFASVVSIFSILMHDINNTYVPLNILKLIHKISSVLTYNTRSSNSRKLRAKH